MSADDMLRIVVVSALSVAMVAIAIGFAVAMVIDFKREYGRGENDDR